VRVTNSFGTALSNQATLTVTSSGSGPIGYWAFDEGSGNTATDTSGNGRNGTITSPTWISGAVNSALSFNGTTSSVVTPAIPLGNAFSISAWVNPAATPQVAYARIAETQYNSGFYLGVNAAGNRYKLVVNTGAGATGACGAAYGCAEGGNV